MSHLITKTRSSIGKFAARLHRDQSGIEAIQVVMILGIAAFILIAFWAVGDQLVDWMKEQVEEFQR